MRMFFETVFKLVFLILGFFLLIKLVPAITSIPTFQTVIQQAGAFWSIALLTTVVALLVGFIYSQDALTYGIVVFAGVIPIVIFYPLVLFFLYGLGGMLLGDGGMFGWAILIAKVLINIYFMAHPFIVMYQAQTLKEQLQLIAKYVQQQ